MVEAIQKIQNHGIIVLSSIICGLESDTVATLRTMREFANASGTAFAQFPLYSVYPGTKDYHEMMRDWKNRDRADYVPKHSIQIVSDKFWLDYDHTDVAVKHPRISTAVLKQEARESFKSFYSLKRIVRRTRRGPLSTLRPTSKFMYIVACFVFAALYPGGIAADNVRKSRLGFFSKIFVKAAILMLRRPTDYGIRPLRKRRPIEGGEACKA